MNSVPSTIISQIKNIDKKALFAWGAKDIVGNKTGEFVIDNKEYHGNGWVKFKIKTPKYKTNTFVLISLNDFDLYDIFVFKLRNYETKLIDSVTEVFVDMLVDVIDDLIEI